MQRFLLIQNHLSRRNVDLLDREYPEKSLDEYMSLGIKFKADLSKEKYYFNGPYKRPNGEQHYFNSVNKAEKIISKTINYEPLSPEGYIPFNNAVKNFIFSHKQTLIQDEKIACIQTVSCTEALRLGFDFVKKFIPGKVLVSYPTYGNHLTILDELHIPYMEYEYLNLEKTDINWSQIKKTLRNAAEGSIVLLHTCCHNPTGIDPNLNQWKKMAKIMKKKNLIPFWDASFLGFQSGDPNKDSEVLSLFSDEGLNMIVCVSFSKIMGIYGERVGALLVTCQSSESRLRVQSQLNALIYGYHEHAQIYGAQIVTKVLADHQIFSEWKDEIRESYKYFYEIRSKLVNKLKTLTINSEFGISRIILRGLGFYFETKRIFYPITTLK